MKKFIAFFLFLALSLILFPAVHSVFAASLQLDPTTVSTPSGQTFTVNVNIDTGTNQAKSADAYIIYNPAILQADTETDGTFFPQVNKDLSTSGKAYVSGMVDDLTKPVTGKGTIATITFKTLIDGTDTLKFNCTAGTTTNTSTVIKADSSDTNIINCTQNGTSTVTVGSGANTTPTIALEPTGIITPAILPRSGVFDNVIKFAVPGAVLLFVGTVARLIL